MAKKEEYPHRVKELQKQLQNMNGDTITAANSRSIVRQIGETQLDLWDELLEMKAGIKTLVNVAITISVTFFGAFLIWLFTAVLPDIIGHLS